MRLIDEYNIANGVSMHGEKGFYFFHRLFAVYSFLYDLYTSKNNVSFFVESFVTHRTFGYNVMHVVGEVRE